VQDCPAAILMALDEADLLQKTVLPMFQ